MAEFYVTYECEGQRVLAIVAAPQRPADLQFPSREPLLAAMNELGHTWSLRSELGLPQEHIMSISRAWLEAMAAARSLRCDDIPRESIFSFGSIPFSGIG